MKNIITIKIKFPTPITDIKIFERNNLNVSINVYGMKQNKKNQIIYPLKVVNEEKSNHYDLLLLCEGNKSHHTFISNSSRLIRTQKTDHKEKIIFCKR
jgi:hypothetical protein